MAPGAGAGSSAGWEGAAACAGGAGAAAGWASMGLRRAPGARTSQATTARRVATATAAPMNSPLRTLELHHHPGAALLLHLRDRRPAAPFGGPAGVDQTAVRKAAVHLDLDDGVEGGALVGQVGHELLTGD